MESGFKVRVEDLERHANADTKGLILNSPSNPTGAVYTRDELEAIVRWAAERNLWLISDEIYARICFSSPRATGALDLDPSLLERVVVVDGASKALAMTGWRLGYSWSAPRLATSMAALQSHITTHAASPSQYAAIAAFRDEPRVEHAIKAMVGVFRHRRERLLALFGELIPGARFIVPDGAFYLFFRADSFYTEAYPDSVSFCRWLLGRTGVALVPGAAFGDDRFVRLSFAAPEDELVEGVRRMGEAVAMEPSTVG
jgi:aspartate aminotransferase